MTEITILLIGNTKRREFHQARSGLVRSGRVTVADDLGQALGAIATGGVVPDLLVLAQAYPGEFTDAQVDRLRRAAPLARLLALVGSWCEGETRTGRPWPGAIRLYWHQWGPRCEQELASLVAGRASTWSLPVTASEEERFLVLAEEPIVPCQATGLIVTGQYDMQDWLARACRRWGYSVRWRCRADDEQGQPPDFIIYDAAADARQEASLLGDVSGRWPRTPIVVLCDFPRTTDRDLLLAQGASTVVSKPLLIEDLFWEIDRLLKARELPAGEDSA